MGSAGCVATLTESPSSIALPAQVESVDFTIVAEGADEPVFPTIVFVPTEQQIRITGTLWGGNSCYETRLRSIEYDTQADALTTRVGVTRVRSTCPDSTGTDTYELLITMQSQLPTVVTATHSDAEDNSATTTARPA
ncbi:hypothetical protein [Haladaptatus sp. DJG-WS-42]|uniref:hypothetical protein n=1 Tax=Haladaptatus sp. DJG-WS-42 TaxID=3120516 RepID=UPI0030CE8625